MDKDESQPPNGATTQASGDREALLRNLFEPEDSHPRPPRLETDEIDEVAAAVRSCDDFLTRAQTDPTYWKWVIIALHNLVQGCMVVALTRSDGLGALSEEYEAKKRDAMERVFLNATEEYTNPPQNEEKLLPFLDLYAKIKKKGAIQLFNAERFQPGGTQTRSIRYLNSIRNEFIHFVPKGWCLILTGVPKMAMDCLGVAEFLVTYSAKFLRPGVAGDDDLPESIKKLKARFANFTF